ncbi:hypothetical protein HN587_07715 [Candidatus Woesearchaeota archaeon]|jgi:hypothetical protein|nr:hypothetical protein [Candidatus Woesearchaeota archaeon]
METFKYDEKFKRFDIMGLVRTIYQKVVRERLLNPRKVYPYAIVGLAAKIAFSSLFGGGSGVDDQIQVPDLKSNQAQVRTVDTTQLESSASFEFNKLLGSAGSDSTTFLEPNLELPEPKIDDFDLSAKSISDNMQQFKPVQVAKDLEDMNLHEFFLKYGLQMEVEGDFFVLSDAELKRIAKGTQWTPKEVKHYIMNNKLRDLIYPKFYTNIEYAQACNSTIDPLFLEGILWQETKGGTYVGKHDGCNSVGACGPWQLKKEAPVELTKTLISQSSKSRGFREMYGACVAPHFDLLFGDSTLLLDLRDINQAVFDLKDLVNLEMETNTATIKSKKVWPAGSEIYAQLRLEGKQDRQVNRYLSSLKGYVERVINLTHGRSQKQVSHFYQQLAKYDNEEFSQTLKIVLARNSDNPEDLFDLLNPGSVLKQYDSKTVATAVEDVWQNVAYRNSFNAASAGAFLNYLDYRFEDYSEGDDSKLGLKFKKAYSKLQPPEMKELWIKLAYSRGISKAHKLAMNGKIKPDGYYEASSAYAGKAGQFNSGLYASPTLTQNYVGVKGPAKKPKLVQMQLRNFAPRAR